MRLVLVTVAVLSVLTANLFGQQTSAAVPDSIFYNGKIITVDPAFSIQEAFAIRGEEFVAVGGNAKVRALAGPSTRLVDLRGSAVIPGLMDNHNHQYRAVERLMRGISLEGVSSLAEILDRLRQAVAKAKPSQTVFTNIGGWDARKLPEKRGPNLQELDQISPDHPVVVFPSGGEGHLNTAAMKAAGISRETEAFAGFPIQKGPNGEPTGVLRGTGVYNAIAAKLMPPPNEQGKKELILKMQQQQNAMGLTSIRELSLSPDIMRVYWSLWREGELTMRVSMGLNVAPEDADKMEQILSPWGVGTGFGDHWLRLDCVAEFSVDGNADNGAYLRQPYVEVPRDNIATPRISAEKFRQAVLVMNRYGWRPSPHITGDKALDMALDAYEATDRQSPIRDKRWVVEHVPLVHPDQMERMARLGILISAQFQPYAGADTMIRFWGKERAERAVPMRELLDHHLVVSTGSDWPGATNNPFVNIYFYVTRKTADGKVTGASEKITREEALRVSSINNAYMTFEEKVKGSIEAGKLADFLILSHDILTVPEEQIRSIHPLATYVGGRKVFSSKDGMF